MRRQVAHHQMIARARIESDGYSRANRSMGVSNGRLTRHTGACRSHVVGVRYMAIPCTNVCQNPGRVWPAGGRSIVRSCISTYSISSSRVSITDGMTWDFPEVNIFGGATGDAWGNLEYITAVIRQE